MGALDQVVKQLILVKADTSQAKAEIRSLSGEEKKAAKERLDDIERQNAKLESSVKGWTKVAAGVTGAVVAFKFASKAAQAAMEDARRAGTAGQGAAKEWQEATAKWKGSVDQLMVSFGKLVFELAPLIDSMAELVGLIAQAVELMSRPRQAASDFIKLGQAFGTTANAAFAGNRSYSRMALDMATKIHDQNWLPPDYFSVKDRDLGGLNQLFGAGIDRVQAEWGRMAKRLQPRKGGKGGADGVGFDGDPLSGLLQLRDTAGAAFGDVGGALSRTYGDARKGVTLGEEDQTGLARLRALLEQAKRDVADWQNEIAQMQRERQQSFLESIFGPVSQFNVYAAGFQLLEGAATAAFDAWITGSMSIGEAVKRAIADGLKALALQAMVESLKHAAFAVGSLAFGNIPAASAHGIAALKFAGVAAVAGVAAREMGQSTGQWGNAGGGSGGGNAGHYGGGGGYVGAAASDGQGGQVVVMLGSDFGMLSTIEQKTLLRSAIRVGLANSRGTKRVRRGA